ncbi:MAG: TetR/AcrR family transcriptional regulator [Spirochaetes bacterium]|nr:TetR/AcrR family transcriptional regulator [Spirochaetota bacterium]
MAQIIKPETKTKIMFAAEKLFNEKGYSKTKITEIMDYCNLATGTFYVYFKDKEMLLTEIYQPIVDSIDSIFVLTPLYETITQQEYFGIIKQEILRLSEFALKFSNELGFLLFHAHDSKYADFADKLQHSISNEFEKFFSIGISHGFIRNSHIPVLSKVCCGIILTMIRLLIIDTNQPLKGIIVQEAIEIIINGIKRI